MLFFSFCEFYRSETLTLVYHTVVLVFIFIPFVGIWEGFDILIVFVHFLTAICHPSDRPEGSCPSRVEIRTRYAWGEMF